MKFTGISELLSELNKGLEKLSKGSLAVSELENLTDISRELHERLIVIRYKAYSEEAGKEVAKAQEQIKAQPAPVLQKPVQEEAPVISVEQVVAAEPEEANPFSFAFKMGETEKVQEEAPQPKPVEPTSQKPEKTTQNIASQNAFSINDKLANEASSLAEKLGKSRIDDLRKAIGINQKFGLISDLFDGDSGAYDLAIDRFNSCTDIEEAESLFNEEKRARKWRDEDPQAMELYSLIERRYI